jgi:hypothetical protein
MSIHTGFAIDTKAFIVITTGQQHMFEFAVLFVALSGVLNTFFTIRYLQMVN